MIRFAFAKHRRFDLELLNKCANFLGKSLNGFGSNAIRFAILNHCANRNRNKLCNCNQDSRTGERIEISHFVGNFVCKIIARR